MTYCREGAADAWKIRRGIGGTVRQWEFGNGVALDGVLAGEVKLALQVLLSDFEIEQGHVDIFVSQQLHEGRQADAPGGAFLWRRYAFYAACGIVGTMPRPGLCRGDQEGLA